MLKFTIAAIIGLSSMGLGAANAKVQPKEKQLENAIAKGDLLAAEKILNGYENVDTIFFGPAQDTPLSRAALYGRPKIVKILLERKVTVNRQNSGGYTALMFAAMGIPERISDSAEVIKLLLNAGADKSLKTLGGETALDMAKESRRVKLIELVQ